MSILPLSDYNYYIFRNIEIKTREQDEEITNTPMKQV